MLLRLSYRLSVPPIKRRLRHLENSFLKHRNRRLLWIGTKLWCRTTSKRPSWEVFVLSTSRPWAFLIQQSSRTPRLKCKRSLKNRYRVPWISMASIRPIPLETWMPLLSTRLLLALKYHSIYQRMAKTSSKLKIHLLQIGLKCQQLKRKFSIKLSIHSLNRRWYSQRHWMPTSEKLTPRIINGSQPLLLVEKWPWDLRSHRTTTCLVPV